MNNLIAGFTTALSITYLPMIIGSVFLGLISGAVPGMSGVMTVVLLVPLTYSLGPIPAFLIMTSVYAAAVYAGSISAIMFRTPGAPEAVVTAIDGYKLTQKGKMDKAISAAVFASAIGGIVGTIILTFFSPQLAQWAMNFADPEYFALAIFGLSLIASLGEGNQVKAFIAMGIGLFVAVVGLDPVSGVPRYTFGIQNFMNGIEFIPVLLGIFAVSEMLRQIRRGAKISTIKKIEKKYEGSLFPPFHFFKKYGKLLSVNSIVGTFIGILPGAGATTGSLFGYSIGQKISSQGDKYGTGIEEGVVAPEVANNSAASGALVPLLALGIPGSATTAVMLGAFILHGLQPGPLLFEEQPLLVYTIFAGLFVANLSILLLNKIFVRLFSKILKIPYPILISIIMVLCMIGAYANRNSVFDIWIMLVFGVIGFYLEEYNYPMAPIILGIVLGDIAEPSLRRALQISNNNVMIFVQRPITAILLFMTIILFISPIIMNFKDRLMTDNK